MTRSEMSRYFWPRLALAVLIPLTVVGVSLALVFTQLREDGLRRERSELQHRIRQEECVIRPLSEVIENRINARTEKMIVLCDSEELLPDLRERFNRLDEKLRASGAYE